jgi:hypothetical protein
MFKEICLSDKEICLQKNLKTTRMENLREEIAEFLSIVSFFGISARYSFQGKDFAIIAL